MGATSKGIDFQVCFELAPYPAMLLDHDLTIVACNAAYEQAVGRDRSELLDRSLFDVFPGSDDQQAKTLRNSCVRVLKTRKPDYIPNIQYATAAPGSPSLQVRQWTISNIPLLRPDGSVFGILNCPADITELMQRGNSIASLAFDAELPTSKDCQHWTRTAQTVLLHEKERLRQLFRQSPSFICVLQGPQHVFELANDAYYQLVGHRDIVGHQVVDVLPEVVAQGFLDRLNAVYTIGEPFIGRAMPIELQRVAGGDLELRYIDLIYQPIRDEDHRITGIFVQGNDVTDAYLLSQEVTYQAAHDSLTGLRNRREFSRQMKVDTEPGSHALLYMDVDHFKIINDRCGHAAGDSLLVEVAASLLSVCDIEHDLLARLGGDEFALVRRNCTQKEAEALADRLCRTVKDIVFIWQGKRYGVTLSIGVVNFGEPDRPSFESALGLADAACFLAKEKGRNRVQLSMASDDEVKRQQRDMDNVSRLKEAMREDRVILYAQKITGLQPDPEQHRGFYEVLARLRDTDGTIIAPSGFIPAAEHFGLIEELDRHIVSKTFAHIQALAPQIRDRRCYFVNLSAITLSTQGFQDFIESTLAVHPGVRSSEICFEVTETAAISSIFRTAEAMQRLVEMGFKFALDDFGSGMASFSYLSHLPVQFVKIDGEFVRGILDQPAGKAIVESVVNVARTLNMLTIAESVECEELLPHLREMRLDYAQGYALHRPEPIQSC